MDIIGAFILFPLATVLMDLDPAYFMQEILLPSPYERRFKTIVLLFFIRWSLFSVVVLEFSRFLFNNFIFLIAPLFTLIKCVNQLIHNAQISERSTLKLYMHLRIILKIGDRFIRQIVALLLTFGQVVITVSFWMVHKCSHILPISITIVACFSFVVFTLAVAIMLPSAVKITENSHKFVMRKMAIHHTFNRYNPKYYYCVKWKSKRLLAVRCGEQFVLNRNAELGYYEILITNMTNAILLINP